MLGSDKGYDHLYEISTRDDNRHTVHGFIPAIMERRFTFIDEQDAIVKCAIRSMLNWRASVDWGGFTWMPSDYLIGLLCINAHDTLGRFTTIVIFENIKIEQFNLENPHSCLETAYANYDHYDY